jgi:hypothetical protein
LKQIVVIFQATNEATERLALAVALGALQEGAKIRLRLIGSGLELDHRGYIAAKDDDLLWANGLVLALEDRYTLEHVAELTSQISRLSHQVPMTTKWAYVFSAQEAREYSADAVVFAQDELHNAGFYLNSIPIPVELGSELLTGVGRALTTSDGRHISIAAEQYGASTE